MPKDAACPACGSTDLFFDNEALSRICSHCGALYDSSQTVIDNGWQFDEGYGQQLGAHLATRALRRPDGGLVLSLQTKEDRRDILKAARHKLIRDLFSALGRRSEALVGRATNIFDLVQERAHFNWGSVRADEVGAACVAIALREANLPESLGELSVLMAIPVLSLTRLYRKAQRLLGFRLPPTDAHLYLSVLASHLLAASADGPHPSLPKRTTDAILSISKDSLLEWSNKLLSIAEKEALVAGRNAGPVACAAVLLALEAEAEVRLQGVEMLAALLAGRLGKTAYTVMERYHEMVKMLSTFKAELQRHSSAVMAPYSGREATRRAKSHSAWLKDVLVLVDEISSSKPQEDAGPSIVPSIARRKAEFALHAELANPNGTQSAQDGAESEYWTHLSEDDEDDIVDSSEVSACSRPLRTSDLAGDAARRAIQVRSVYARLPRTSQRPARQDEAALRTAHALLAPARGSVDPDNDVSTRGLLLRTEAPPDDVTGLLRSGSRLSRLVAERGGEHLVEDDELFADGELDSYIDSANMIG
ncbi:hypothetical protein CALVIDRAFT_63039 [Calocera viscosa TUFC12733]|uniref:TFIIB-type domain-containing protein n=1 Tax=Calocera viscosa (strain TUFC12733) TaxID=1330018 RepID=A0A167NN55_CALVF|nr:hypothetical protein CALVIDRAFT_63039 [Calocera viscosa TUFC12733]